VDTPAADRVFFSWEEARALPMYIEWYLRSRRIAATPETRERVLKLLGSYKGPRPLTKADLDYYLDANLGR
jgi:hypothetical protein